MTQIGEQIAINALISEAKDPEDDKKEPITLRFSLFFDGTMNNRVNIDSREQNKEAYRKHGTKGSSYDNGRTNIDIMEPHLGKKANGFDLYTKEYIEGIGTFNEEKDSKFKGGGMGGGSSGVVDRAELGINKVYQWVLNSKQVNKSRHVIKKLTIDVFGFSRGAAAARYAIYLLLKDKNMAVQPRLENFGYKFSDSAVEVGFAGLYDTVLSYYLSQWSKKSNNRLQQKSVKLATKVIHLAAADEHRKNFPLHNIKGAKSNGGEEYFLPGVHSDVGGSYNQADEEQIKQLDTAFQENEIKQQDYDNKLKSLVMVCDSEEEVLINEDSFVLRTSRRLEADKAFLIEQGWFKEVDKTGRKNPDNQIWIDIIEDEYQEEFPDAYLYIRRPQIKTGYSSIPLKIMADFARGKDGKLTISPKLERRANLVIEQSNLNQLENLIKQYVAHTTNSKPDDWLHNKSIKEYRNEHFHFSATSSVANGPRIKKGKRKRFIYDA